jgi:hypothetical protein
VTQNLEKLRADAEKIGGPARVYRTVVIFAGFNGELGSALVDVESSGAGGISLGGLLAHVCSSSLRCQADIKIGPLGASNCAQSEPSGFYRALGWRRGRVSAP